MADPKITAQQIIQQAADRAANAMNVSKAQKADFEKMMREDFGTQMKMPGSHAQKAVTIFKTLAAIKQRQKELTAQIVRLAELIRASEKASTRDGKTAYEHWRKHAGGEKLSDAELVQQQYRAKQEELARLHERNEELAKQYDAYKKRLDALIEEYDEKYQKLDENHQAERQQLAEELLGKETQLTEACDQELVQQDQIVAVKIQIVEKEIEVKQQDLGKAEAVERERLQQLELKERANLQDQFTAVNERLESLRNEAKHASTPQAELQALQKISEEAGVPLKPSMMKKLKSGEAIDEKIAKLQKENVLAQEALTEKFQTQAQAIKQDYAAQSAELTAQRDAALANVNAEDKAQRAEINQKYNSELQSLYTEYQDKFSKLESRQETELKALQEEQAQKVAKIEQQLAGIQAQQATIQKDIGQVSAPTADVKREQVQAPAYKTPRPTPGTTA